MTSFTFFHNVDIGSKNGKAMVAKTAGASAQIKVAIPSCPGSHCILSSVHIHCKKKKIQSLSVLKEAVKIILLTLSIHVFLIFCVTKMGGTKYFCSLLKCDVSR